MSAYAELIARYLGSILCVTLFDKIKINVKFYDFFYFILT